MAVVPSAPAAVAGDCSFIYCGGVITNNDAGRSIPISNCWDNDSTWTQEGNYLNCHYGSDGLPRIGNLQRAVVGLQPGGQDSHAYNRLYDTDAVRFPSGCVTTARFWGQAKYTTDRRGLPPLWGRESSGHEAGQPVESDQRRGPACEAVTSADGAPPVHAEAAPVGGFRRVLDVDVEQIAGHSPLVVTDRLCGWRSRWLSRQAVAVSTRRAVGVQAKHPGRCGRPSGADAHVDDSPRCGVGMRRGLAVPGGWTGRSCPPRQR